jgi:UV DNA damage repair endonuclease
VYNPPGLTISEHNDLNEYLINTIDLLRNNNPDLGLVIMGDFNNLEIRSLTTSQNLKQVVDQPTRESAILDLILTNLHNLYDRPNVLAPLGSSDHNIVLWLPSVDNIPSHNIQAKPVKSLVRRYPRSGIDAFGRWATTHNWFCDLDHPTLLLIAWQSRLQTS